MLGICSSLAPNTHSTWLHPYPLLFTSYSTDLMVSFATQGQLSCGSPPSCLNWLVSTLLCSLDELLVRSFLLLFLMRFASLGCCLFSPLPGSSIKHGQKCLDFRDTQPAVEVVPSQSHCSPDHFEPRHWKFLANNLCLPLLGATQKLRHDRFTVAKLFLKYQRACPSQKDACPMGDSVHQGRQSSLDLKCTTRPCIFGKKQLCWILFFSLRYMLLLNKHDYTLRGAAARSKH